jgi:hypothetical protein
MRVSVRRDGVARSVLAGTCGLLLTLVAGCGGTRVETGAAVGSDSTSSSQPVPARPLRSTSPATDFMSPGLGRKSYVFAVEQAVAVCLRAKGWAMEDPVPDERLAEPTNPADLLEWRKKYGYGQLNVDPAYLTPSPMRAVDDRNRAMEESWSSEQRNQYAIDLGVGVDNESGKPPSGCRGEAEQKYRPRFPAFNQAIAQGVRDQQDATRAHPDYLNATSRWSACMSTKGYSFHEPRDAPAEFAAAFEQSNPTEELKAEERAVGLADAECSMDTVWPVRARLEADAVQKFVTKYGREATCGPNCD